MVVLYSAEIGQDAYICFREWAKDEKLGCLPIQAREFKGSQRISTPYSTTNKRIFESLDFSKYFNLLTFIFDPPRKPLTRRVPVAYF